jgi:hypothetical protein
MDGFAFNVLPNENGAGRFELTKRWFQNLLRKRLKHTREQASSRKASWISARRS